MDGVEQGVKASAETMEQDKEPPCSGAGRVISAAHPKCSPQFRCQQ